ncbi:MAG: hypothetical protein ACSLFD_10965 [Solirubrobacterales bacterium]
MKEWCSCRTIQRPPSFAGGMVVEHWSEADIEDLIVQIGVTLPRI